MQLNKVSKKVTIIPLHTKQLNSCNSRENLTKNLIKWGLEAKSEFRVDDWWRASGNKQNFEAKVKREWIMNK